LQIYRASGDEEAAEAYKQTYLDRMWDVSAFMKLVKQRFTQWFNRSIGARHAVGGTI